jgi:hypothetical protein
MVAAQPAAVTIPSDLNPNESEPVALLAVKVPGDKVPVNTAKIGAEVVFPLKMKRVS